jgi:P27 family predicted phage terminase small subunit
MGRPSKSVAVHELHGTRDHSSRTPSAFVSGRPKYPSHLSKEARAEMKRCCGILERRHVLTEGEVTILTLYSTIYARWVSAKRQVGDDLMIEFTVLDSNGAAHKTMRLNPLLKVISDAESRLLALAKSLGLTPVDRERSKQTAVNPGEEIIPGSIGDLYPELVGRQPKPDAAAVVFTPMPPPATIEEDEPQGGSDANE